MSGEYREHQPSEALKPFVDCFWTRVGWPGLETRVLPDAAVDIIFDLAAVAADGGLRGGHHDRAGGR